MTASKPTFPQRKRLGSKSKRKEFMLDDNDGWGEMNIVSVEWCEPVDAELKETLKEWLPESQIVTEGLVSTLYFHSATAARNFIYACSCGLRAEHRNMYPNKGLWKAKHVGDPIYVG